MVEAGRRRLDPAKPAAGHHRIPWHRHLRVPAEDVGGGQFECHPLLSGIDERGLWNHGLNLPDVFGLDGVTEDDAHARFFAGTETN